LATEKLLAVIMSRKHTDCERGVDVRRCSVLFFV